jgi:diaminopimelate epimerase
MNHILQFTKMQGLGNDFIVLNNLTQKINLSKDQIRLIADRHFGIGCDQILILDPPPQDNVDFGYRIYNADGSMSGQCGNGARCLARFIHDQQLSTKTSLKVATPTAIMELQLLPGANVRVNMGVPKFAPETLPMLLPPQPLYEYQLAINGELIHFNALSMGNPHIVIRTENVAHKVIDKLGAAFNAHPQFPEGVNVGFMQIVDRTHIKLRVFERGCGETLACGSGACAALVAARLHDWVEPSAEIALPGGSLIIEWKGENHPVLMTGEATTVFTGEYLFKNF